VQHAQKVLELIQLSWTVSENWRGLTHLHIRLTKVALLIGDVLAFALAALLAAVLARPGAMQRDAQWLVSQDLQRYGAWLGDHRLP